MDTLKELLYVLTKYKVRQVNIITNREIKTATSIDNKFYAFYEQLISGDIVNEKDMANWLSTDIGSKAYRRFINDFKKRLYNTLLFIDINAPLFTDSQRAFYVSWQQLAVLETLVSKGLVNNAFEIAKRLEKAAAKFEFTEISLRVSLFLRRYYALYRPDARLFERYSEGVKHFKKLRNAEIDVQEYFYHLQMINSTTKSENQQIGQKAKLFVKQLASSANEINTIFFQVPYWYIRVIERMSLSDWEGTVNNCQAAINFLDQKKHVSDQLYVGFLHQQAASYLMLKEYEKAGNAALRSVKKTMSGGRNWFKGKEIIVSILLHKDDYQGAWEAYKKSTRHPQFKQFGGRFEEPWKIYHAYLAIIVKLDKLVLSPREKGELVKFRLSKFLNDLPLFARDKRGMNIPVLIVQVLFLLKERQFSRLEDRLEALRKYRSRHFTEQDEHFRTDCFIRMLHLLIKADFELKKVKPKAEALIKRMSSVPLNVANQTHEIEVVPYERQWEWVLEMLD